MAFALQKYEAKQIGTYEDSPVYDVALGETTSVLLDIYYIANFLGSYESKSVFGIVPCQNFLTAKAQAVLEGSYQGKPVFATLLSCGCNPSTTLICFTISGCRDDGIGNTITELVSGAVLTLKNSTGVVVGTCTTDGTGKCCISVSKKDIYSCTAVATGYITTPITGITVSVCGITIYRAFSAYGSTWTVYLFGGLCGNFCTPTSTVPITITYTQVIGGSFSGSYVLSSSSFSPPIHLPIGTYSVSWSAEGHITNTNPSCPLYACPGPGGVMVWGSGAYPYYVTGGSLNVPPLTFCFIPQACFEKVPASLTVVFDNNPNWFFVAGTTWTCFYVSVGFYAANNVLFGLTVTVNNVGPISCLPGAPEFVVSTQNTVTVFDQAVGTYSVCPVMGSGTQITSSLKPFGTCTISE